MPIADDGLKLILAGLERFEGRTAYIYNDSANPPNRTVGVGCLLEDPGAACRLPFRNVGEGRPATAAEITADFLRVKAMPGGLASHLYRVREGGPVIELDDDAIATLGIAKLTLDFIPGLREIFPRFDDFPNPAQCTLIDMAWNLGLGRPPSPEHRASGLYGFPSLIAACNRGDWEAAAKESHVATSRDVRNQWRSEQFLAARTVISEGNAAVV